MEKDEKDELMWWKVHACLRLSLAYTSANNKVVTVCALPHLSTCHPIKKSPQVPGKLCRGIMNRSSTTLLLFPKHSWHDTRNHKLPIPDLIREATSMLRLSARTIHERP
jgi:hypothetical protein